MAVPKRRMSRSNTRSRRANWKATAPDLVSVQVGGAVRQIPRRLVQAVRHGLIDPERL
ncbi:50S ribosomal protein L32 [Nocardia brevicatena]|uniref:50S ribosomal protein L32 n=1 Tax=Nocardia brevicatena TaxID=37327 RepID=UPI00059540CF|nr:50S ribosomal protein L32 [Nocardia brevicatena]